MIYYIHNGVDNLNLQSIVSLTRKTANNDLIYKLVKTTPKEIMCPATRPVTNQNGWEYEVGIGKKTEIDVVLGKLSTSRQYVRRVDETGTNCYYRTNVSLGESFVYDISVAYEIPIDCRTREHLGAGYLTYDESIGFLHLSDGKISILLGGTYDSTDINSISASGGYRVYAFGGR